MRILTRYVLFDLLKVFLLTVTGLTLLIFIVLIGKEAVDKGISLNVLLQIFPYVLPQALQFAVPGSMLMATTSIYGRMASYNEIVAIKSLGISPMVLVWPSLFLATLVSFVAVVLNDVAVSWGTIGQQRVVNACMEETAYRQLALRKQFSIGKANIMVHDVVGRQLISPTVIYQQSQDKEAFVASADEAELHLTPAEGKLVIKFHNLDVDGSAIYIDPETFEFVASIDDLTGASPKNRSPSNYALSEIPPAIEEQEKTLEQIRQANVAQTAFGMLTGDFDSISNAAWKPREKDVEAAKARLYRLHTESWRRWANGFSCLFFVLIGIPVSIRMRFSEFIASFFICFLPILVVYYPLLVVSVSKAKDGVFPPQCVWIGNVVLGITGIWMLRRANKH